MQSGVPHGGAVVAVTSAPMSSLGMASYPGKHLYRDGRSERSVLTELPPFGATMQVVGMETGYSAKRLVLKDMGTGMTYPMFVADAVKLLEGVDLEGIWEPTKRGQNYGIKKVKQ